MALAVEEEVLWLEVPVHNLEGVEIGEGGDNLCCVELCSRTAVMEGSSLSWNTEYFALKI